MTGFLNTQNRRDANLVSKPKVFCILGTWDYFNGMQFDFC